MKKMKYKCRTLNAKRLTRNAENKKLKEERLVTKNVIKFFSCCFVLLICTANTMAQIEKDNILLLKNFPFLYMIEKPLKEVHQHRYNTMTVIRLIDNAHDSIKDCKSASCFSSRLQFTNSEIDINGRAFVDLVMHEKSFKKAVNILRRGGLYPLFKNDPDTAYVRKVWEFEARGIAYILNTYVDGQKPLYPKIDSISFNKEDPAFHEKLAESAKRISNGKSLVFYSIPMLFAIEVLKLNGRDEAARYELLTAGENEAAFNSVKKIKWKNYSYSAILVPGLGPEQPDVKLDPNGAKRCDSAAVRYREGKAPFIVVSGGHVHPNKTPYCEAIEMKKYMVDVLKIPASAIIIEPHARHTTTNLRNTNRLIFRFKIPFDKAVLIVTDAAQNTYINGSMKVKVIKELGYTPFSTIKKLSATETEYLPSDNSRQVNTFDPLDP